MPAISIFDRRRLENGDNNVQTKRRPGIILAYILWPGGMDTAVTRIIHDASDCRIHATGPQEVCHFDPPNDIM
jgi:hypothetical protein